MREAGTGKGGGGTERKKEREGVWDGRTARARDPASKRERESESEEATERGTEGGGGTPLCR